MARRAPASAAPTVCARMPSHTMPFRAASTSSAWGVEAQLTNLLVCSAGTPTLLVLLHCVVYCLPRISVCCGVLCACACDLLCWFLARFLALWYPCFNHGLLVLLSPCNRTSAAAWPPSARSRGSTKSQASMALCWSSSNARNASTRPWRLLLETGEQEDRLQFDSQGGFAGKGMSAVPDCHVLLVL